jgi:hypothetical protein
MKFFAVCVFWFLQKNAAFCQVFLLQQKSGFHQAWTMSDVAYTSVFLIRHHPIKLRDSISRPISSYLCSQIPSYPGASRELQRQRCKNFQRITSFLEFFFKTLYECRPVLNSEVVGLAPGLHHNFMP